VKITRASNFKFPLFSTICKPAAVQLSQTLLLTQPCFERNSKNISEKCQTFEKTKLSIAESWQRLIFLNHLPYPSATAILLLHEMQFAGRTILSRENVNYNNEVLWDSQKNGVQRTHQLSLLCDACGLRRRPRESVRIFTQQTYEVDRSLQDLGKKQSHLVFLIKISTPCSARCGAINSSPGE